jgi:histidinol-phosphate phosphatase family protein
VVLFDRDGTLIVDVPYNGDPALVQPVSHAFWALGTLRQAGIRLGVVTNQSGIARGWLTADAVRAVNARVDDLLGPFAVWRFCPHCDQDGCPCRKPAPGMIVDALFELAVAPSRAVLVGDSMADVEAGRAAGVRTILVPNERTLPAAVRAAPEIFHDLRSLTETLLASPQGVVSSTASRNTANPPRPATQARQQSGSTRSPHAQHDQTSARSN